MAKGHPEQDLSRASPEGLVNLLGEGLASRSDQPEMVDASSASSDFSLEAAGPLATPDSVDVRDGLPFGLPVAIPGYEILGEIGRGGMGRVYKAIQHSTHRTVALKVLLEGPFSSERTRKRFEREVRIAAALRHPNIAQVYESGLHEGRYWFAMEYIAGRPLDIAARDADYSLREKLSLMAAVCDAIGYAHGHSVIHRDLKPGNILVTSDGQPRILDFGLAKIDDPEGVQELTVSMPGDLMGTPAYMSPEQTERDPARVDARTDVYSLGVVLYRLLTDQFPYNVKGRIDEIVREIATAAPVPPAQHNRQIDGETEAIILKALSKHPDDRYANGAELAADLRRCLAGEPLQARLHSRTYRLTKAFRRHRSSILLPLAVIGGMLLAVCATWMLSPSPTPPTARPPQPASKPGPGLKLRAWTTGPSVPQGFNQMRGAVLSGRFYLVGGCTGSGQGHSCVTAVQVYDPPTRSWFKAAPLPEGRAAVGLVAHAGHLYCLGGLIEPQWRSRPADTVYRYDPSSDSWTILARMPVARSNFVTAVLDGKIFCAGGNVHWPDTTNRTDVFDPAADVWSTIADMPEGRGDAVGGAYRGKLVVAYGLKDARAQQRNVYTYHTGTTSWMQPCVVRELFGGQGLFLFNDAGGMYFAGTRQGAADQTWISRFDPESGGVEWICKTASARACSAAAFDAEDSVIYVAGEAKEGTKPTVFEFARTDRSPGPRIVPPLAVEAQEKAAMPKSGWGFSSAWLGGKLHVLGGENSLCGHRTDHFVYDPAGNTWTTAAPMTTKRMHLGAAACAGKIYAIAGNDSCDSFTDQVESFDPATGAWRACAPLPIKLAVALVAASVDDRIYVAGGHQGRPGDETPNQNAYMYEPDRDRWLPMSPFPVITGHPQAVPMRSAATIGTNVYVIAGSSGLGDVFLYAYDTACDVWRERGVLPFQWREEGVTGPQVFALDDGHLAVVTDKEVDGRVRVYVYSVAENRWLDEVDTSGISYDGWRAVRVAGYGDGFYVLGGCKLDGGSSDCSNGVRYFKFAAADRHRAHRSEVNRQTTSTGAPANWDAILGRPVLIPGTDSSGKGVLLEKPFGPSDGPLGAPWKTYLDAWRINGGDLVVDVPPSAPGWAYALYPALEWRDYALECDFRQDHAKFSFLFRVNHEPGSYYSLCIQQKARAGRWHDDPSIEFLRCQFAPLRSGSTLAGMDDAMLATKEGYEFPRATFQKIRIEVKGATMRVYVDGNCLLTAQDKGMNPPVSGGIGFAATESCFVPCHAVVRNLRVLQLER